MLAATPLQPHALWFRDPLHGLLAYARCPTGVDCAAGRIEATSDGGRTWRVVVRRALPRLPPAPLPKPCRTGIGGGSFAARAGALVVAVCGSVPGAGNEEKRVFRSRDGGRTWREVADSGCGPPRKTRQPLDCYGYPAGIAVARDGFAVVWESRGTLWVSRDAGSTWTGLPQVVRPEQDFGVDAVVLPGGVAYVLLATGGGCPCRLIATRDAGRTWRTLRRWAT